MYTPPQFREDRPEILAAAIRDIQLAAIVTAGPSGLEVSHAPMVLKEEGEGFVLEAHLARANGHWRALGEGAPAVAIFGGPQAYVSPSWYPSKREHGKVVPTWNYVAVHAHGRMEAVTDAAWLRAHLDDLTAANEAGRPRAWAVSDAPAEFVSKLSSAIVGLRMPVERLEGSWKMIQHRPEGDRHGTIEGLSADGHGPAREVAAVMRALEDARRPA
jgi:transcriptional regulator